MIRLARLEDIPELISMVSDNPDTLLPRTFESYRDLLPTTYVAEVDGKIAGSCVLEVYSPKIAEIRTVVVRDEFRRKGIGQALVQTAIAEAKRQQIYEIMVVTSNLEFFKSLDFGQCLNEKYALFLHGK